MSAFLNPFSIPLELIAAGATELGPILSVALVNIESDPVALDELLEPLTQYSLIRRNSTSRTYSIHRMVQAVLKDGMDTDTRRLWIERAVRAVNRAFSDTDFSNWSLCESLLSHVQTCAELIEKWILESQEATRLLDQAGGYLCERARFVEAEELCKQSLEIREKTLGQDHLDVADSLNNLGVLYHDQGKYDEAEQLHKRALEIRKKVLKPDHPDVANNLNNLALLYHKQGKYIKAKPFYIQAIKITEKSLGQNHPDLATFLKNYAGLLRKINWNREAVKMEARAKAIRAKQKQASKVAKN